MKRRPRFLPKYVTSYRDRHGKARYRYRRQGRKAGHFKAELGSSEFMAEYAAFEASEVEAGLEHRHPLGTIDDLITRYVSQPSRLGPTDVTQHKVRAILDRFRTRYGAGERGYRYAADFTFEHIDAILSAEREKRQDDKRMIGGIEAARKLRKELVRLFDFAEKIGMRPVGSNPVRLAEHVRVAPGERTKGYHSWTEAEIAQYRQRHALGTKARLALELLLWTGQRRGDGYLFKPADVLDGRIRFTQSKGGKEMWLPLAPQLLVAITAMPPQPHDAAAYLLSELRRPYSYAGFGNRFRAWCDQAGLPGCTAHGLRKANARRLADLGKSNQTLKAVGGWTNDREVAIYTAAADQVRLADLAIAELAKWEADRV